MQRVDGRSTRRYAGGLSVEGYRGGVHVRCPSCGGGYDSDALKLRHNATRGLAICSQCYHVGGPDGFLERRGR